MKVKPRNAKLSGLLTPRFLRLTAAWRPNSITRVLTGWSDSENAANRSRIASRNRRASSSCSKPATRSKRARPLKREDRSSSPCLARINRLFRDPRQVRLVIQPDVLEARAVVYAVDHAGQTVDVRPPAGDAAHV